MPDQAVGGLEVSGTESPEISTAHTSLSNFRLIELKKFFFNRKILKIKMTVIIIINGLAFIKPLTVFQALY